MVLMNTIFKMAVILFRTYNLDTRVTTNILGEHTDCIFLRR
jgi:hypothetical protein